MNGPSFTLACGTVLAAPELLLTLPAELYHASPGVSASGLKKFARSPAHYKYAPRKESDAFRLGAFFHSFTLEPELFAASHIVEPSDAPARPTKAMREAKKPSPESQARVAFWDEWDAKNEDKTVVTAAEFARLNGMLASVRDHADASRLFRSKGRAEASAFARHAETGLWLRSRFDFIPDEGPFSDAIVDVKTCEDASEHEFARDAANYRYHVQAAFYLDQAARVGVERERFIFAASEKSEPYPCNLLELHRDSEEIRKGREIYERQLRLFAECVELDSWPAYGSRVRKLTLPAWALS